MRLLLDTQILLWFLTDDPKLPPVVRAAICEPDADVFVSVASVWEAVIKQMLGKLTLPGPAATFLPAERDANAMTSLPVEEADLPHLASLPPMHRDPFDRLLVAQALRHGLTLATADAAVRAYPVPTLP